MITRLHCFLILTCVAVVANAAELKEAKVTQIIHDVKFLGGRGAIREAAVNDAVRQGDAVRTGQDSRAELKFSDLTITRLGANTVFSFNEAGREVTLDSGALLLQVPRDGAPARINTAGVTAAISGGTAMCEANKGHPFKLMVLEGTGKACTKTSPPDCVDVGAGEMITFANGKFSKPEKFDVGRVYRTAHLLTDFPELPNADLIAAVIALQEGNFPPGGADKDPLNFDSVDQRNAGIPGPRNNPPNHPPVNTGKFGPPVTISSPDPYVINSSTVIQTDPTITTNGVTDQGKIFRGRNQDGLPSDFLFGNTTAFDQLVFDNEGSTQVYAVFKFAHLELAGNPTINVPSGGATNLALVSVGDLTSGMPGGTLTFSGMERVFFGTQDGSINLGSEISFADLFQLEFYARGTGAGLTIASTISVDRLRLFSEGSIQIDGDESAENFKAISGTSFDVGEGGSVTANEVNIRSLGDMNIDLNKFSPTTPGGGGSFELNATNTLNLTIQNGVTFGWDSLDATAHTINIDGNATPDPGKLPPTLLFDFTNSSSATFFAGTGGINAGTIDFFGSNLTLESEGDINIGSAMIPIDKVVEGGGSSFLSGIITAAGQINSLGNIETQTLTSGGDITVSFGSITAGEITAGNPHDSKSFASISAPFGITAIGGSITATGDINVQGGGSLSLEQDSGEFGNISAGGNIDVSGGGIFTPGDPCVVFAAGTISAGAVITGTLHGEQGIIIDNSFTQYSFGIIANTILSGGTLQMTDVPEITPNNRVDGTPVDFLLQVANITNLSQTPPILQANGTDATDNGSGNAGNGGKVTVNITAGGLTVGEPTFAGGTAPTGEEFDLRAIEANGGQFPSIMGGIVQSPRGFVGGNGGEISITTTGDFLLAQFSHIQATTGLIPADGPDYAGNGGEVAIDSGDSQITIDGTIQVSSNEGFPKKDESLRRSASGGFIDLYSAKEKGMAIDVSSSGQLLALLANAAPGEGGAITFTADGIDSSIHVAGEVRADRGRVEIVNNGDDGLIDFATNGKEFATIRADIVKVGALGSNGVLTIGSTAGEGAASITADTLLMLYADGSSGRIDFKGDVTLSGELSRKIIAANTINIFDGVTVTIDGNPKNTVEIYTDNPNYSKDWGGNGKHSGNFAGGGAPTATPAPFKSRPPFATTGNRPSRGH